jgi:hypothetical protein
LPNPCKVRLPALYESLYGQDKDSELFYTLQAASLPEAGHAFRKTIARLGSGAEAASAPQDGKAQHPFGMIIGQRNAVFLEKQP